MKPVKSMHHDAEVQLRNQAIWETAVDAIVTINALGKIIAYNPAAEILFGYSQNEAINQNVTLLMPESHGILHNDYLQKRLQQPSVKKRSVAIGHSRSLEGQHKDGHTFPIRLSLSEMIINGQCQFTAIIQDISELKATEDALRDSEQRLRCSQGFAGIGTWDWNIENDELYWTEQIPPLFGYSKGELETSYENFLAAVHLEDRLQVEDAITACLERNIPYDIEHRVVWPDGSVHWLHEQGDVIRDNQGKAIRMLGIVNDITKAKQTQLALYESEARFRDIAESMSDWIWEVDANGVYTYCSGNVEAILGYRPDEILGKTPFDLMPAEEAENISGVFVDIVKQKRPINNLENWNLSKDGHRICLVTNGVPLVNSMGVLTGYRGVDKDITDRKKVEVALIKAKDAAEQANLAKSVFLSNMSHELRTPLNAIIGFSQLITLENNLNKDQQKNLNEINRAGEHLLELINEILDLAKVEAGRLNLKMTEVSVSEILEECYAISRPLTKEHAVHLNIDMDTAASVYADRTRLKQVLLNLISNGIKYNRSKGIVEVKVTSDNESLWRITISDTGRGISPDNIQNLFQPFNRLGFGQSQIEGTGIGLVISKSLVEAMGGSIGVKSTYGKGSEFWIEIPRAEALDIGVGSELSHSHFDKGEYENKPVLSEDSKRILSVEGCSSNQILLHTQLESLNYEVDIASNAIEALEFLSKKTYQVVFTDCDMSIMSGFQLTEIIRQQENGQNRYLPIIAISPNSIPIEKERCCKVGMDDYLTNPIKLADLQSVIEKYWTRSIESKRPLFSTSAHNADHQMHFDISVLRNTLGTRIENHRHVLSLFSQSAPGNVKEIEQAINHQDHEKLHAAAHKLKSAAQAIGARLLAAICQLLETNSYPNNWEKVSILTTRLTTAMTQVEEAIADYI